MSSGHFKVYCPTCNLFRRVSSVLAEKVRRKEVICSKCGNPWIPVISGPTAVSGPPPADHEKENTPFIITSVECPICAARNPQRYIKSHEYYAKGKDIDSRPTDIHWVNPVFSRYHPEHYYAWHCPACHFAAPRSGFEDPAHNTTLRGKDVVRKLSSLIMDQPEVTDATETLGAGIDYDQMDFFHAIKTRLLSIYWMEKLDEIRDRDSLELARYYLRLGWLFRDMSECPAEKEMTRLALEALATELAPYWADMPLSEQVSLQRAARYYEIAYERSGVLKKQGIEHNALQTIGRIYLRLDDRLKAKAVLHEALKEGMIFGKTLPETPRLRVPQPPAPPLTPEEIAVQSEIKKQRRVLEQFLEETRRLLELATEKRVEPKVAPRPTAERP